MASAPSALTDYSAEDQATINRVVKCRGRFEKALGKSLRERWNEEYRLYRNYSKTRDYLSNPQLGKRDGQAVLLDMQREWGAKLFIPLAYATIETIVPRAISNPPEMTARPNTDAADVIGAADKIARMLNKQQADIGYELILQATARRGFIHGLGVQKTYWEKKTLNGRRNVPVKGIVDRVRFPSGLKTVDNKYVVHDGPMAEDVDVFDFFWEPTAKNIRNCEWVIHRTWRSFEYVTQMVERGRATKEEQGWRDLDLESVKGKGTNGRDAVWQDRMTAAGFDASSTANGELHEVWEYHNRSEVITILDRELLVQQKPNPNFHGDIPFQIFRPTMVSGEFVGISEIAPIAHLINELNTLRGQRRDNATLKLNPPTFYQQGLLTPNSVVHGPGVFVPTMGPPQDILWQQPVGDIPGSGYQEEDVIKADVDKTTGISDAVAGGAIADSSQATATGIQLVQAAANVRIALKTKNLMNETVAPAACQWFWLNRQKQLKEKENRIDNPDGTYSFEKVSPKDWNADLEIIPNAKSTEPDNLPQQRQDALNLLTGLTPFISAGVVDPAKPIVHFLHEYGIADAEGWVQKQAPPQDQAPAQGFDPAMIGKALDEAQVNPQQQRVILTSIEQMLTQQRQQAQAQQSGAPSNGAAPQPTATGGGY